jgi:hypothetical protein
MSAKKGDAKRFKKLGEFGERCAAKLLESKGFQNIKNLNNNRRNHKFSNLLAEKDGRKYYISVKARNKWEKPKSPGSPRRLNVRYKLGRAGNCLEHAKQIEAEPNATAAWLTICVDEKTFSAYFGAVKDLQKPQGKSGRKLKGTAVMMTDDYTEKYTCLAKDKCYGPLELDYVQIRNC